MIIYLKKKHNSHFSPIQDVLGSAKGWAASLMYSKNSYKELEKFRNRPDTFSLGVCNGCQLMALLGWIDGESSEADDDQGFDFDRPTVFLDHNKSGRYESRFSTVRVEQTNAVLLRGMSGTRAGIWVAHGEGKIRSFSFKKYGSAGKTRACWANLQPRENLGIF